LLFLNRRRRRTRRRRRRRRRRRTRRRRRNYDSERKTHCKQNLSTHILPF